MPSPSIALPRLFERRECVLMIPKVVQVVAGIDFTVYVYFLDGSIRLLDAKPLLEKGGVFSRMWQDYQTSVQWKVAKEVQ